MNLISRKIALGLAIFGVGVGTAVVPTLASAQEAEAPAAAVESTEAVPADDAKDHDHDHGKRGHARAAKADVSDLLGLTQDELIEAMQSGQTLAEIAEANGVSRDALVEAMLAPVQEHLAAAVEEGKLTADESLTKLAAMRERVEARIDSVKTEGKGNHHGKRGHRGHSAGHGGLDALSELLGLTDEEMIEALRGGQTLAELGEANGVSREDLAAAMLAPMQERLTAAVEAGDLTQDEADAKLAEMAERVEARLDGTASEKGKRGHGKRGHRGHHNHGADTADASTGNA